MSTIKTVTDAIALAPCECGEWSGERCQGELGPDAELMTYVPDPDRGTVGALGGRGVLGADAFERRVRVTPECALLMLATDGEWCWREDEDDGERSARKIEIEVIEVTPAYNAGLSWDVAVRVGGVDGAVTMTRDRQGRAVRCDGGGTDSWLSPGLHGLPCDVHYAIEQAAGAAIQSSGVEPSADARDDD